MVFNKSIRKQTLLAVLLFFGSSVCADEANKMSIIDDQTNYIMIESFNFERLSQRLLFEFFIHISTGILINSLVPSS